MGKIGDLFVRLGLKSDDYKKGMANAKKETTTFSQGLGKMKAGALAVWGAIGASVTAFAKSMINATNRVGDAWAMFTSQAKASWDVFLQSLSTLNWDNFIGRIREANAAARELQSTLNAEFEVSNSIKLQKAAIADELAELEVIARDQTKSYQERADAAKKYLDMVKPLYDQELKQANKLEDVQLGKWLAGSGLKDSEQLRNDLHSFLIAYGKDDNLVNALSRMMQLQSQYDSILSVQLRSGNVGQKNAIVDEYRALRSYVSDYEKNNGYGTSIYELAKVYEQMRGDADTQPLVDAMINAGEAAGAFKRETKRMHSALSMNIAQINKVGQEAQEEIANTRVAIDALPALGNILGSAQLGTERGIGADNYYADLMASNQEYLDWYAGMVQTMQELNYVLEDSIISATQNGLQAFTDMLFGLEDAGMEEILAAFIAPFGDTLKQMGSMIMAEGIAMEAFKKSFSNPYAAIAAGAALIAIGSAVSSGLQRLTANPAGGGSSSSYGSGSSSYSKAENYESTLTVNVVGTISGSDIALSLDRTKKNSRR